ncbi:MAG: hypothetical protein EPO65_06970, partial [Dehalococcoidia bacterium]
MRYLALAGATLIALALSACGSDKTPAPSAATAAAGTATAATTPAGSAYTTSARALLTDLGAAQRGLADAIAGSAPLSDPWKQAVSTRVTALAGIEERAQKLTPPADQQAAQTQILLAARRSREAAETISTAVSDGNVSMLERANSLLADATFQTSAAVALLPR